jgi:AraC-like DNA-binding protein
MPSSQVRTFTDPHDYTASLRRQTSELTIFGRGHFSAKIVIVDLHRLSMRRLFDNLPRIAHSVDNPGFATISFRTQPGSSLRRNGVEMLESSLIRRGRAESYFQQSDGPASFGSITLSDEDMAAIGEIGGYGLTPLKDALTVRPSPVAMARFQSLHAAAGTLAEDAPTVIRHPAAARHLEQALVEAMVGCLGTGEVAEDRSAVRQHAAIMRRFYRATDEHPEQALYVPELCSAIGVSERTLRVCCEEHLGTSPTRYMLLRRMHLARQALRAGDRTTATVTEIATEFGFWQLGRFAGEYKTLFGELPSDTLARPAD